MRGLVECSSLVCKKHLKKEFVFYDVLFKVDDDKYKILTIQDIYLKMQRWKYARGKEYKQLFKIIQDIFFSENNYRSLIPNKDVVNLLYNTYFGQLSEVMGDVLHRFYQESDEWYEILTNVKHTEKYDLTAKKYKKVTIKTYHTYKIKICRVNQAIISYLFQSGKYKEVLDIYEFLKKVERVQTPDSKNITEYVDEWVDELKNNPWDFKMTRHEKTGRGIDKVGDVR